MTIWDLQLKVTEFKRKNILIKIFIIIDNALAKRFEQQKLNFTSIFLQNVYRYIYIQKKREEESERDNFD